MHYQPESEKRETQNLYLYLMTKKISIILYHIPILIFAAIVAANMSLAYATVENNRIALQAEEYTYEMRTEIMEASSDSVVTPEPTTRVSVSHIVVTEPITVSAAQQR